MFFTQVADGAMKKVALCGACADERGVDDPEGLLMADQLLGPLSGTGVPEAPISGKSENGECLSCGFALENYQKVGRFGCSECYGAFRQEVTQRIPSLHRGGKHEGRIPQGLVAFEQRKERLTNLALALESAVEEEDYEKAAKLRDQIQEMENSESTQGGAKA